VGHADKYQQIIQQRRQFLRQQGEWLPRQMGNSQICPLKHRDATDAKLCNQPLATSPQRPPIVHVGGWRVQPVCYRMAFLLHRPSPPCPGSLGWLWCASPAQALGWSCDLGDWYNAEQGLRGCVNAYTPADPSAATWTNLAG
jgi:hypothetical protein